MELDCHPNAPPGHPAGIAREPCPDIIVFDVFALRAETGELWKAGTKIKLQQKPRLILEALLRRPGELVTREQLRKILWSEGTFVDFESGLNTAINRLRMTLGDSADTPRYIETLPRLGYRFIWPLNDPLAAPDTATGSQPPAAAQISLPAPALNNSLQRLRMLAPLNLLITLLVLFALMLIWHQIAES